MSSRTRNCESTSSYSHFGSSSQPVDISSDLTAALQICRQRRISSASSPIVLTSSMNSQYVSSTVSPVSPVVRHSQSIRRKKRSSSSSLLNSSARSFSTHDAAVGIRIEGRSTDAISRNCASASTIDLSGPSNLSPVHIKRTCHRPHEQHNHSTSLRRKSKARQLRGTSVIREAASASANTSHFEDQREGSRKRKAKASSTSRSKSQRRGDTDGAYASRDSISSSSRRSNSSLVPELLPAFETSRAPNPQDMAAPLDMTLACSSDDGDDDEVEFVARITGVVRPRPRPRPRRSYTDPMDELMHVFRRNSRVIRILHRIAHRGALGAMASEEDHDPGASRESIGQLPVNSYSEIANDGNVRVMHDGCIDLTLSPERNEKRSCTICLEEFGSECKVKTLPCFHIFHAKCITEWLRRKAECPICRTRVPK